MHIHLISLSSHILVFAISFYFYGANVNANVIETTENSHFWVAAAEAEIYKP